MLADEELTQAGRAAAPLPHAEAVQAVAASARRLFPLVSGQQARDLAGLVLADLQAQGIILVRSRAAGG